MATTQSNKVDSYDALAQLLVGVILKIKANLPSTKPVVIEGNSMAVTKVASDFQSYVDLNTAVDTSKASTLKQVNQRKALRTSVKKELAGLVRWAVTMFGPAAYDMLGVPAPKPTAKPKTAAEKAIAAAKRKATVAKKAAAQASVAPKQATFVAYDESGNVIGGTPANAPVAPVAPVATAGK